VDLDLHVGAEAPSAYQGALAVSVALIIASALPMFFVKTNRAQAAHEHIARPRLMVKNRAHVVRLLLPTAIGALGAGMFVPFTNVFW